MRSDFDGWVMLPKVGIAFVSYSSRRCHQWSRLTSRPLL